MANIKSEYERIVANGDRTDDSGTHSISSTSSDGDSEEISLKWK